MALWKVVIGVNPDADYKPTSPLVVHPGDEVEFEVDGRTDSVTVTFTPSSPFTQTTPFTASSSSPPTRTVKSSVTAGRYSFTAESNLPPSKAVPGKPGVSTGEEPERPGTVSGGLEVSTDPK